LASLENESTIFMVWNSKCVRILEEIINLFSAESFLKSVTFCGFDETQQLEEKVQQCPGKNTANGHPR